MPKKPWNIRATFEEGNHSQLCIQNLLKKNKPKQIKELVNGRGARATSIFGSKERNLFNPSISLTDSNTATWLC